MCIPPSHCAYTARMTRVNFPLFGALLLTLLGGCVSQVGTDCDEPAARTIVYTADDQGLPMYAGQALIHQSCGYGAFCHTESPVAERYGVPAGLDFDMELAVGSDDVERLRRGQRRVYEHRDSIWTEVKARRMPPPGVGAQVVAGGPSFLDLPALDSAEGRQILHNWLACGAPVVERTTDSPRPAGVVPVGAVVAAMPPASCSAGFTRCGGECVDLLRSGPHCGACDTACTGSEVCIDGSCSSAGCPAGMDACAGSCVDLQLDMRDCGSCGTRCPTGGSCDAGVCACAAGLTDCAGVCTDLQSDPSACGACAMSCASGSVCSGGACLTSGCPSGTTECSGACVDTNTSALHCGSCANACPAGSSCVAGACSCGDVTSDPMNCGACGVVCASGRACVGGVCDCGSGQTRCGGVCVDTQTSAANCGACGAACPGSESCQAGACVACGGDGVSFAGDLQPIFTSTCSGSTCHAGRRPAAGLSLAAGSSYANLVGVAASGCSDGRVRVAPGAPDSSYILDKLLGMNMCRGQQMPLMNPNLPTAQTDMIRSWICDGAPNN